MQEDNYTHIEELIERFFEGSTSNKEEKELYSFFSEKDIPEHLKKYQQVFSYFDETINNDLQEYIVTEIIDQNKISKITWWLPLFGIATTILLLFMLPLNLKKESIEKKVQGYIILNGEKITDMELIASELEAVIFSAEQKCNNMEQKLLELSERESVNTQKITYIKEKSYEQIVSEIFTVDTQKEVLKILENQ